MWCTVLQNWLEEFLHFLAKVMFQAVLFSELLLIIWSIKFSNQYHVSCKLILITNQYAVYYERYRRTKERGPCRNLVSWLSLHQLSSNIVSVIESGYDVKQSVTNENLYSPQMVEMTNNKQ